MRMLGLAQVVEDALQRKTHQRPIEVHAVRLGDVKQAVAHGRRDIAHSTTTHHVGHTADLHSATGRPPLPCAWHGRLSVLFQCFQRHARHVDVTGHLKKQEQLMPPCSVRFGRSTHRPSRPESARKCAEALVFSSGSRIVYNHARGFPACTSGRFPLKGNYTTTILLSALFYKAFFFSAGSTSTGI